MSKLLVRRTNRLNSLLNELKSSPNVTAEIDARTATIRGDYLEYVSDRFGYARYKITNASVVAIAKALGLASADKINSKDLQSITNMLCKSSDSKLTLGLRKTTIKTVAKGSKRHYLIDVEKLVSSLMTQRSKFYCLHDNNLAFVYIYRDLFDGVYGRVYGVKLVIPKDMSRKPAVYPFAGPNSFHYCGIISDMSYKLPKDMLNAKLNNDAIFNRAQHAIEVAKVSSKLFMEIKDKRPTKAKKDAIMDLMSKYGVSGFKLHDNSYSSLAYKASCSHTYRSLRTVERIEAFVSELYFLADKKNK